MAKTTKLTLIISCCIALLGLTSLRKTIKPNIQVNQLQTAPPAVDLRAKWFAIAKQYVGIKERTNRNDHDSIAVFNKFARSSRFGPYCAAGLFYTSARAGLSFKIQYPAGVRYWFTPHNTIWSRQNRQWKSNAQLMDVVWIFTSHIEGLAQQTIRRDIEDDDKIITIGFNTGTPGGVYHPIQRRWRDVRRVANPFLLN